MTFQWKEYSLEYVGAIDSWLDDAAIRMTGIEKEWHTYWKEVLLDSVNFPGCEDHCRVVHNDGNPIAVISFGYFRGDITISEILVAPELRGNGYGTEILRELLLLSRKLFHKEIVRFRAVVFSQNQASQRIFEKAGFDKHSMPDGMCYEYILNFDQAHIDR